MQMERKEKRRQRYTVQNHSDLFVGVQTRQKKGPRIQLKEKIEAVPLINY